ncbi:MAG: L,D-transpeptidase family protein [Fretibacterium sp.]|nr:L,D-transpeptidase family protein [Fretibacterium sp.]
MKAEKGPDGPQQPVPVSTESGNVVRKPDLPDDVTPAASHKPGTLAVVPDEIRPSITRDVPAPAEKPAPKKKDSQNSLKIDPNPKKGQSEPKKDITPKLPAPPGRRKEYWIHIDKGDYTLSLYRGQNLMRTYSIAVGKNPGNKQAIGDHRTPVGNFRVVSIENASKWKHDFGDGKGKIDGAYGPWFIRLDAGGWKGIGIHGTHDPDSRGTMATEGCIRLSNEEIQDLKRYAYRNMRVVIEE